MKNLFQNLIRNLINIFIDFCWILTLKIESKSLTRGWRNVEGAHFKPTSVQDASQIAPRSHFGCFLVDFGCLFLVFFIDFGLIPSSHF